MVLEAVHCPCLWLEITAEMVMLLSPLALRAWALWRLLAWPLAASSSHIRPGGQVAGAVMLWAGCSQQVTGRACSPGTCCSLSSSPTCLSRRERHCLSVPSCQAMTGLPVGMCLSCPGNVDMFRKEMFFLNILF